MTPTAITSIVATFASIIVAACHPVLDATSTERVARANVPIAYVAQDQDSPAPPSASGEDSREPSANHEAAALAVIDKLIAAQGGVDKIRTIRSLQALGSFEIVDTDLQGTIEISASDNGDHVHTMTIPGAVSITTGVVNGVGWEQIAGNKPQILPYSEAERLQQDAHLHLALMYRELYSIIEFRGKTMFEGQEANELRLVTAGGIERLEYFATAEPYDILGRRDMRDGAETSYAALSEYVFVDGYRVPRKVLTREEGQITIVSFDSYTFNRDLKQKLTLPREVAVTLQKIRGESAK